MGAEGALSRLCRDRVAIGSVVVIVALALFALSAPLWARWTGHSYHATFPREGVGADGGPVGPSRSFWLGADSLGRDVLVRAAYGARVSLLVGLASTALATVLGVVTGVVSGYLGGLPDALISRFMDVTLSLPYVLVAMVAAAAFGAGTLLTILVIAFFSYAAMARVVRGQVLSIKERQYVEAARALGAGRVRIMTAEILPGVVAPVTVLASLLLPGAIVFEATLSFLGAGADPGTPSWGSMLSDAQDYYRTAWWFLLVPAGLLLAATFAFNLLGDAVRDAFDPHAR